MSSTDVVTTTSSAPVQPGPTQQRLSRMHAEAMVMARSSFLPEAIRGKKNKPRPIEEIAADVMAIALTAEGFGIPVNLTTIGQFAVIGGQAVPSTQLLCGVAERSYGHDVWIEEATADRATACMVHRQTGREHSVTYTVEDAIASGALDFTVENWKNGENGRFCAETLFLGRSMEEAKAALASAPDWAKKAKLKFNPAWHNYRADMLAWRAVRRVLKRGAPSVVAGLPGDSDFAPITTTASVAQVPALPAPAGAREEAGEARSVPAPVAPTASQIAGDDGHGGPGDPVTAPPGAHETPSSSVSDQPLPPEGETAEELAVFDHRRKHANAAMGKVGIKSDDARHEWVKACTSGRTESTARLTQADLDAVVLACERLADEDPGPADE